VARRAGTYAALALVVVMGTGGCGAASPDSPPSGVDELVVPTPSPDPRDFVRRIDNPWLAFAPGRTWRYRVTGSVEGTLVITVEDTTYDVAGVATTPVSRTEPTGEQVVDYYAQDRQGNVWWLGREGVWLAGTDGAEAGLAMPATPRLGDGWQAALDAGVVDVRATVASTDQAVTTPAGQFDHLVGLDLTSPLELADSRRLFYERGTGLVEDVSTSGPVYLAELETAPG
jgi:hypothetical protein